VLNHTRIRMNMNPWCTRTRISRICITDMVIDLLDRMHLITPFAPQFML